MTLATAHEARLPAPIPDAYWVIPNKLLAGEYPGAEGRLETRAKLSAFLVAGIEVFIDLTEGAETLRPYAEDLQELAQDAGLRVMQQRMPIRDCAAPTRVQMAQILDAIVLAHALRERRGHRGWKARVRPLLGRDRAQRAPDGHGRRLLLGKARAGASRWDSRYNRGAAP